MDAVRIRQLLGPPRSRPGALAGDKGCAAPRIRRWLRKHAIKPVIPLRTDEEKRLGHRQHNFDRKSCRRRSIIESRIGWLKGCRHIATRSAKLVLNFVATVKAAIVHRYVNVLSSDGA